MCLPAYNSFCATQLQVSTASACIDCCYLLTLVYASCASVAEYHAALIEAANAVEAETGAPVGFDGASPGYKKFADKVKAFAQVCRWHFTLELGVKPEGDQMLRSRAVSCTSVPTYLHCQPCQTLPMWLKPCKSG